MKDDYDDYVDISDVKFGSTVKVGNRYYKLVALEASRENLVMTCAKDKETSKYADLNHKFIRLDHSAYEFDDIIPIGNGSVEITYTLFLKL